MTPSLIIRPEAEEDMAEARIRAIGDRVPDQPHLEVVRCGLLRLRLLILE
jgi:hypothetical protein